MIQKGKKEAERIEAKDEETVGPATNSLDDNIQQSQLQTLAVLVDVKLEEQHDSLPEETVEPATDSPNDNIQQRTTSARGNGEHKARRARG